MVAKKLTTAGDVPEPVFQIDTSKADFDLIAKLVAECYNEATMHRSRLKCGRNSLQQELMACKRQREGTPNYDISTQDGREVYVNVSANKAQVLSAFLIDLFYSSSEAPFSVKPTEIPDLSEEDIDIISNTLFTTMMGNEAEFTGTIQDLEDKARFLKEQYREMVRDTAQTAATNMERLMKDQIQEGKLVHNMEKFNYEFTTYPFAVMLGPLATPQLQLKWKKNKLEPVAKLVPTFKSGTVWDTYWSPDSTTPQDGTYIVLREYITHESLIDCLRMGEYYEVDAVREILGEITEMIKNHTSHTMGTPFNRNWTTVEKPVPYRRGESIEILTYYGKVPGSFLKDAKVKNKTIDEDILYECVITTLAHRTIRIHVYDDPCPVLRPVHIAKMFATGDGIYGTSMLNNIRDLDEQFNDYNRLAHNNAYMSSADLVEIDTSRMQVTHEEVDGGEAVAASILLAPGMVIPMKSSALTGDNSPAIQRHSLATPNQSLTILATNANQLVDRFSGIPASMHGEVSGANRTFRGLSLTQGSSIKIMLGMVRELDIGIFSQMALALYRYNMMYSDDETIKGDCNVFAQGAQAALERELAKQSATEALAGLGQVLTMTQAVSDPEILLTLQIALQDAILKFLEVSGVDVESAKLKAKAVAAQQKQEQMVAQMNEQAQEQMPTSPPEMATQPPGMPVEQPPPEMAQSI